MQSQNLAVLVLGSMLFTGAVALRAEPHEPAPKAALLGGAKPAKVSKAKLKSAAHALAHQKAEQRHLAVQKIVEALHAKVSKTQSPEFLANASCAKMVEGTIENLEWGYTDVMVSKFLNTACDSFKIYLNFGGPEKCQVIFENLVHEYEYDRNWAKWCADSQAVLAAGPAGAPGPAAAGPAGAGAWVAPWLASGENLEGPSPEFFKTCDDIVQILLHRSSRGNAMGKPPKIEEYLTIICSVPRDMADEDLCNDFKTTFLEHMHPRDHKWNVNTMDSRLFCNGFYKVLVQHVGFHRAMATAGPAGAPSGAPAGPPAGVAALPPADPPAAPAF